MSQEKDEFMQQSGEKPVTRREMSRRQFLSYTLGGTGGFLAAAMMAPMLRFAIDPLLQSTGEGGWTKVVEVSKITKEPQEFTFEVNQVDGWVSRKQNITAWIMLGDDGKPYALSPICKHLGCTVNWNTQPKYPNEFFCPCHEARYSKDGLNLAVAPAPLDEYDVKVENDFVYIGQIKANTRVAQS